MSYAFLSSPMSPFLQRKVNELDRLRAPKTIKTLLEHLVKTVEDSESIQAVATQKSSPKIVANAFVKMPPVSIQKSSDEREIIKTNDSKDVLPMVTPARPVELVKAEIPKIRKIPDSDSSDDETPRPPPRKISRMLSPRSRQNVAIRSGPPPTGKKIWPPRSIPEVSSEAPVAPTLPTSPFPSSMIQHRDQNSIEYIQWMCEYMEKDIQATRIPGLREHSQARVALYKNYMAKGLLLAPKRTSRLEQLPIYVFLMAPRTRKAYLEGVKLKNMPFAGQFHEHVFKASMVSDGDTVQLLEEHNRDPKVARWLEMCVKAIVYGKDWRVQMDVIGVIKVDSVEKIPDGSFLACFREIPDISAIQSKSLNCVVIQKSPESSQLISQQSGLKFSATVEGWAVGRRQKNFDYTSFGPRILIPTLSKIPTSRTLASLFSLVVYNKNRGRINENIYVVEGFF